MFVSKPDTTEDSLDIYVCCTLTDNFKYDFAVPQIIYILHSPFTE